jgi:hypothetical protein
VTWRDSASGLKGCATHFTELYRKRWYPPQDNLVLYWEAGKFKRAENSLWWDPSVPGPKVWLYDRWWIKLPEDDSDA